jgi:predicted metal-dependent HD superfamily phosphohydrolase
MQDSSRIEEVAQRIGANHSFQVADFPDIKAWLKVQWVLAVGNCPVSNVWFERLFSNYTESTRHYHTPVHLKEMLDYIQALEETGLVASPASSSILRLATFFHDAIYDPTSSQNEVASAALFDDFCQEKSLDSSIQTSVKDLILATEKHKVIEASSVEIVLQKHFLDMDMAVLGKQSSAYMAYAGLIRKEYNHVPWKIYCEKRAEILETFGKGQIFQSELFQRLLETQAQQNLRDEIDLLKQGIIPGD